MFTGTVEALGTLKSLRKENANVRFEIKCPFVNELKVDQSISHNGVCLTVEKILDESYEVVAVEETLTRSNLGKLKPGDSINLERSMKLGDRLDGHLVQGHVDETATVIFIKPCEGSWLFALQLKAPPKGLLVEKGSVCINGISLTVVNASKEVFSVAIIPFTYENTNFKNLKTSDLVNIEYDIIGKYVQRMIQLKN